MIHLDGNMSKIMLDVHFILLTLLAPVAFEATDALLDLRCSLDPLAGRGWPSSPSVIYVTCVMFTPAKSPYTDVSSIF